MHRRGRGVRAAYPRDLSATRPSARSTRRGRRRSAGCGRAARRARRRAGDGQGQYRDPRRADAARHGGERSDAGGGRRAARGAAARSRRDHVRQDDDAGLRHVVLGPVELSPADPQSLGARPQSRRLVGGRGRRGGGRLRAAACRHRHRRLGPPARRLVRHFRAQAERRPRPDRPALYRPRRRADDAQRRRRGAADGDAVAARRARLYEPAAEPLDWAIAPASLEACGSACCWRPAAAIAPTPEVQGAVERAARDFAAAGRDRRAARAVPDPGDARRARPLLAHAIADRPRGAAAEKRATNPALHPRLGGIRPPASPAENVFRGFNQILAMRKAAVAATQPSISSCRRPRR